MHRFLSSSGLISILDVVRVIVVAKLLGPYFSGLCMTLMVIPQTAQYLNLGTIESLTVFGPQYKAKGMTRQIQQLKNNVLNYTVLTSVASFVLIAFYAMFFSNERAFVRQSMVLAASLIVLWEMKQFFVTNYAVEGNFLRLSWVELTFTILAVAFQLTFVYHSREYGFWLGLIAAGIPIIVFSARDYFRENRTWYPILDIAGTREILPMGLMLVIASITYAPFIILARIFLAGTVGVHEVGLFLLSVFIISKLSVIPNAIAKVILPHMSYASGNGKNFETVFNLYVKAQIYTLTLTLFFAAIGAFVLQPAVSLILPNYLAGIPAAKIMLIAAIPYCLVDNANNVLLALEHKRLFMLNLAIALVLQTVISIFFYISGQVSSETVSTSFVFVFSCYALLANYQVLRLKVKATSSEIAHA